MSFDSFSIIVIIICIVVALCSFIFILNMAKDSTYFKFIPILIQSILLIILIIFIVLSIHTQSLIDYLNLLKNKDEVKDKDLLDAYEYINRKLVQDREAYRNASIVSAVCNLIFGFILYKIF
jgi:hypothetical protein